VKNIRTIATTQPVTIEAKPVTAHAFRFTAVLEKLPATPYHPKKLLAIFASHCQKSSLFAETLWRVVAQTNFATLIDSVNHISPITTAEKNNPRTVSKFESHSLSSAL
jgi:hypothetical protein